MVRSDIAMENNEKNTLILACFVGFWKTPNLPVMDELKLSFVCWQM